MSITEKFTFEVFSRLKKVIEEIQRDRPNVLSCPLYEDEVTGEIGVFPIFNNDTDIDIINRYFKFLPKESQAHLDAFSDWCKYGDAKGFSKLRLMRITMKIPINLYQFLKIRFPDYWQERKTQRRFSQICSKLSVGKI